MKDSFFWRVIGVGIVVGLFTIGYGLCKNSQVSPSFSSDAYADDAKPAKAVSEQPKLNFTYVDSNFRMSMRRAKVIGGWLVATQNETGSSDPIKNTSITFFPDPKHEWDGGSLE